MVDLKIGDLSGVQAVALHFALDALTVGTPLEETIFQFHRVHILLFCDQCENEYPAALDDMVCPGCDSARYQVLQGKEMIVQSISGEKNNNG